MRLPIINVIANPVRGSFVSGRLGTVWPNPSSYMHNFILGHGTLFQYVC